MKYEPETNDARLLSLFAQLASEVMKRGLHHARRDDPHGYVQALKFAEAGRFQLRIDINAEGITTRGVVVDKGGDAVVQVFSIGGHMAEGKQP